jgi:hypothetical protein
MIMDKRNLFCNATALNTGAAGSYLIGDVIDLEDLRDIGQGEPLYLVIQVETAATSGGAATGAFSLCSDAQAAIAVDGSQTTHLTSPVKTLAQLATDGHSILVAALPMEGNTYERYLGIVQTTAVAAFTAGKVTAFLTPDVAKWKAYADATN